VFDQRREVAGGVEAPIQDQTAHFAAVHAFGQAQLGFHRATARTRLGGGIPAVGEVHAHARPVGFVLDLPPQFGHADPGDMPGQSAVAGHAGHVEVFQHDRGVRAHQTGDSLCSPIGAVTIEDSLAYENGTLSNGGQAGNGDRNGYNLGSMTISDNVSIDNTERNFNFDGGSSVFRNNTSCRSGSGTTDRTLGNVDGSNRFWSGTNGSRCSSYADALRWSYASDGRLVVTFG
jgi:hypothetical protein